jgi:hypothetical protein
MAGQADASDHMIILAVARGMIGSVGDRGTVEVA